VNLSREPENEIVNIMRRVTRNLRKLVIRDDFTYDKFTLSSAEV